MFYFTSIFLRYGEIQTNVKLLFNQKEFLVHPCLLNKSLLSLHLSELMKDKRMPEERKQALIDKLLDKMIEFQKLIDTIEELLR